jgi:hypothetical protein
VNTDRAHPDFASCGTRLVGAKLEGRIHRPCCAFHHSQHAYRCLFFQASLTFSPVNGALPEFNQKEIFLSPILLL